MHTPNGFCQTSFSLIFLISSIFTTATTLTAHSELSRYFKINVCFLASKDALNCNFNAVSKEYKDLPRMRLEEDRVAELLRQKWFWKLFIFLLLALMLPLLIVGLVLYLSPSSLVIALIVLIAIWYLWRSYREWKTKNQGQNEEDRKENESTPSERTRLKVIRIVELKSFADGGSDCHI